MSTTVGASPGGCLVLHPGKCAGCVAQAADSLVGVSQDASAESPLESRVRTPYCIVRRIAATPPECPKVKRSQCIPCPMSVSSRMHPSLMKKALMKANIQTAPATGLCPQTMCRISNYPQAWENLALLLTVSVHSHFSK